MKYVIHHLNYCDFLLHQWEENYNNIIEVPSAQSNGTLITIMVNFRKTIINLWSQAYVMFSQNF